MKRPGPESSIRDGRPHGFRPFTGPASLKRCGAWVGRRVDCPFPALHRAGLIEAMPVPPHHHQQRLFPALHRAGLIEATATRRGTASAAAFPALHRAGLIEACYQVQSTIGIASFRPFTGPASLKQAALNPTQDLLPRSFRPFTGPASLKPAGAEAGAGAPGSRFPALHRAGLIEARDYHLRCYPIAQVSGPSQGRPH